MFKENDVILYGSEGVCRIDEICEQNFGRGKEKYFILKPIYRRNSTVCVPAKNETLVEKMHRVLSESEIYDMISRLSSEDSVWIEDKNARKVEYKTIITTCDSGEMLKWIRAVYLNKKLREADGKRLYIDDERFLRDAEKILYDEFAFVLNIEPEQVMPFIAEQIESQQK